MPKRPAQAVDVALAGEGGLMARRGGNRWGRFRISSNFLETFLTKAAAERWEDLKAYQEFMGQVLVVRADDHPAGDFIEYWGISRHFEEIQEGEAIPLYGLWFRVATVCPCGERDNWDFPGPPDGGPKVCGNCGESIDDALKTVEFDKLIRLEE